MGSPTQRSLAMLRKDGYTVAIVEHWDSFARIRRDLFGIIDLLALKGEETLAVQTTSYSNMSARAKKIADSPNISAIREAGWSVAIHGWRKKPNGRWECKVSDVS